MPSSARDYQRTGGQRRKEQKSRKGNEKTGSQGKKKNRKIAIF